MSGPWHPTGRATVNSARPEAHGICDRCGFRYLRRELVSQYRWAGTQVQNQQILVCTRTCLDRLQPNGLRTIIIPPDPVPVINPRPEQYQAEVNSILSTESLINLVTENGDYLVVEIGNIPGT